jgi:hypothetical protein
MFIAGGLPPAVWAGRCRAAVPGEHPDPAAGSHEPPDVPSSKVTGAASDQDG